MERYRYIAKRLLTAIPTFLGYHHSGVCGGLLAPSSPLEILFNDPMPLLRRWQGRVRNWD